MNFLKRLFSKKSEAVEQPLEFLEEIPPDWLITLSGQVLPHGNAFQIRASLFEANREGTARIFVVPRSPEEKERCADVAISSSEFNRLKVTLGFSFPDDIASVASEYADGLPFRLAIHRREPYSIREGESNLAGWLESKASQPPLIEIAKLLIEIKRCALPNV